MLFLTLFIAVLRFWRRGTEEAAPVPAPALPALAPNVPIPTLSGPGSSSQPIPIPPSYVINGESRSGRPRKIARRQWVTGWLGRWDTDNVSPGPGPPDTMCSDVSHSPCLDWEGGRRTNKQTLARPSTRLLSVEPGAQGPPGTQILICFFPLLILIDLSKESGNLAHARARRADTHVSKFPSLSH